MVAVAFIAGVCVGGILVALAAVHAYRMGFDAGVEAAWNELGGEDLYPDEEVAP